MPLLEGGCGWVGRLLCQWSLGSCMACPRPVPFPFFCTFSLLVRGDFSGKFWVSFPLGIPSRIPLGLEHVVVAVKLSTSWSVQGSGSDA